MQRQSDLKAALALAGMVSVRSPQNAPLFLQRDVNAAKDARLSLLRTTSLTSAFN